MTRDSMIAKCESFLGTVGRPNEATRWYAARNGAYFADAAWCDMFLTWAAHTSGNYDAVCLGKDYAYTVWHAQAFQAAGRWYTDTDGIQRGDIVFFDWDGSNAIAHIDHVGIVTDVNGRDVLTIEGNTDDRCARRVRNSDTIAGYGRPDYSEEAAAANTYTVKKGDTLSKIGRETGVRWQDIASLNGITSPYTINIGQVLRLPGRPPAPTPTPEPTVYVPPPFPAGLRPNRSTPSAKPLQTALKKAGYMANSVTLSDNYGPKTQEAVRKFYTANANKGWQPDIAIGPLGWAELHREAYGTSTTPPPAPEPPPGPVDDGEPAHDYRRVTYGGKTVNVRTREMLKQAVVHLAEHYSWTPYLTQGSYNTGVDASAGTHDGGGVVDIRTSTMSAAGQKQCVQALRKAGFAAWLRTPADGFSTHIHAVAIGDRELSPEALTQIQQWREDTNGLANHGPDPEPDPYPAWTQKYR